MRAKAKDYQSQRQEEDRKLKQQPFASSQKQKGLWGLGGLVLTGVAVNRLPSVGEIRHLADIEDDLLLDVDGANHLQVSKQAQHGRQGSEEVWC